MFFVPLGAIILLTRNPSTYQASFRADSLPPSDEQLLSWYRGQPNLERVSVERRDHSLVIVTYRQIGLLNHVTPDLGSLGYKGVRTYNSSRLTGIVEGLLRSPIIILAALLSVQVGFLIVALRGFRRALSRDGLRIAPSCYASVSTILSGVAAGVILVLLGFAYDFLTNALINTSDGANNIWSMVKELRVSEKTIIVVIALMLAPICEELFFRGVIFHSFLQAGKPFAGMIVSSLLFAIAHLNPRSTIIYFIFGVLLAWVYRRTHSLLAPIIAHSVNNALAFAYLLTVR